MSEGRSRPWLPGAFWLIACVSLTLVAIPTVSAWNETGKFAGWAFVFFLAIIIYQAQVTLVVALLRRPKAYGVGSLLVSLPVLWAGLMMVNTFIVDLSNPSQESLAAGHGYFSAPADRALADAIIAGDSAKVAALAPAANLRATGWDDMTFMRLALMNGQAHPDVVSALLKAGIDPDVPSELLFGHLGDRNGIINQGKNERLLRVAIDAGVDLNFRAPQGDPRFFSALMWPEGLAIMLENGANTEAEDKDGRTAIMVAVRVWVFPAIPVLLAHGARLDHIDHEGKTLRDLLQEKFERFQHNKDDLPLELVALDARLKAEGR